jgi:acyl-CoA thioesterase I
VKYLGIVLIVLVVIVLVGLVSLSRDVAGYREYWNRRASQPVEDNALVYVALGDSTAQSIGSSKPERGYVGLLADALEAKHNRPVHVINLSVSGAKLHDALKSQLPEMKLLVPDVVTIEIGANDMQSFEASSFRRDMDALMQGLPSHTVVSDVPYFGGGRRRSLEPNVIQANKIIHELAAKYKLRLAPLHQVTKDKNNIFVNAIDFFHPSNQGYQNWFSAFWQILQK